MEYTEIASGLRFPEGPIAMPDGSIILVEIERGTLTRCWGDGKTEVIAETGGGPNGAAIGPDGAVYICNNGGFEWTEALGLLIPGHQPEDYSGGRIERVDLATGKVDILYTECGGNPLRGPNDIVFDAAGGFWFTDHGKTRHRDRDEGGLYYALPDGSSIKEVVYPLQSPNGVGLSPDEDKVVTVETHTGRAFQWEVTAPGEIVNVPPITGLSLLAKPEGFRLFDSLAIDAKGNVCAATIGMAGITIIAPDGSDSHIATDDPLTTNICFGGEGLKTAYITLSGTGRLVSCEWPEAGLPLNFLNEGAKSGAPVVSA